MTLAHCISCAIYVRVLFIIKIVLSFTIDILLKILALTHYRLVFKLLLFMEYSKPRCSYKIVPMKKIAR